MSEVKNNANVEEAKAASSTPIITMVDRDMKKVSNSQRIKNIIYTGLIYLFLLAIALIVLFPVYWMIILKNISFLFRLFSRSRFSSRTMSRHSTSEILARSL